MSGAAVELREAAIRDPDAVALNEALAREGDERGGIGPRPAPPLPADLSPPHGLLLVAYLGEVAAGLGGIRYLDTDVAEIKRMFVPPRCRGRGIGRRILTALESVARERGCRAVRLDSSSYLTEAVALYRSAGYSEIPDYNGNPDADIWFERELEHLS